jgi:hypothetical protein
MPLFLIPIAAKLLGGLHAAGGHAAAAHAAAVGHHSIYAFAHNEIRQRLTDAMRDKLVETCLQLAGVDVDSAEGSLLATCILSGGHPTAWDFVEWVGEQGEDEGISKGTCSKIVIWAGTDHSEAKENEVTEDWNGEGCPQQ